MEPKEWQCPRCDRVNKLPEETTCLGCFKHIWISGKPQDAPTLDERIATLTRERDEAQKLSAKYWADLNRYADERNEEHVAWATAEEKLVSAIQQRDELAAANERLQAALKRHHTGDWDMPPSEYADSKLCEQSGKALNSDPASILAELKASVRLEAVEPYRWRPICEMHEDFNSCVLVNIADPGYMEIGSNLDSDYNESDWTHFMPILMSYEDGARMKQEAALALADATERGGE